MALTKYPPIEKIPEALSVLADGRITMMEDAALILSSNGTKEYTVLFDETTYASNDSATYWQGYPGYPILSVWMKQGILSVSAELIPCFQGIDWHALNKKHKRNYAKACEELYTNWKANGIDVENIKAQIQEIYDQLPTLSYMIKRNPKKPVKHE